MNQVNSFRLTVADGSAATPFTIQFTAKPGWTGVGDRVTYSIEVTSERLTAHNTRSFDRAEIEEFLIAFDRIKALSELNTQGRRQYETANLLAERISFKGERDISSTDSAEQNNWNNFRSDFELRILGNESVGKIYFNFQHGHGDLWRMNFTRAFITEKLLLQLSEAS